MRKSPVNDCRAILKIREYLACGLQVVCNDGGDAALFADCAYVEPDLPHVERRLALLLSKRIAVNAAGRRFVEEHFSWHSIIGAFLLYLRERKLLPPGEGG
jgi:glycosyltransferase involved in cell wall biosynthesis